MIFSIDLADSSLVQLCHVTYVVERGTNRLGLEQNFEEADGLGIDVA